MPGSDAPSTLGGPGWQPRALAHAEEIATLWGPCGVRSHVAPLKDVLLAIPGDEMSYPEPPGDWLMLERPDLPTLKAQADALADAYEQNGVRAWRFRPSQKPPPNHLFYCDLFFMTPEGAILARMAARQRAGEERVAAEALARVGVPILLTPRGHATFEGADAMWIDAHTVLIGVGRRTNGEVVAQITPLLHAMGVEVRVAEVGPGVQHLLGVVNPFDESQACVLAAHMTPSLRAALKGWRLVELPSDEETEINRAMNYVPLEPRKILMPARCPRTRERYEAVGIECVEVEVSEYVKAAGAIGCATGIVRRG